jgi:hypothetical protein
MDLLMWAGLIALVLGMAWLFYGAFWGGFD